ncbi:putative Late nodulin [Medicago truncatula]|uniref:Putative Late nodulin n=1 Tax=Medicago truncatula TaxID=3880 RepID=A0A396I7Z9_MEDTR|nr:putative Late nodulin [Medicago truncatula]
MTAIFKFVYAMTFFISLFLALVHVDAFGGLCVTDAACPQLFCSPKTAKCIFFDCHCV